MEIANEKLQKSSVNNGGNGKFIAAGVGGVASAANKQVQLSN